MAHPKDYYFRAVPTKRVARFIDSYIAANYTKDREPNDQGNRDFACDSGLQERYIYRIRMEEMPNVPFDTVDRMLTSLGCLEMWHLPPEAGGFNDFYYPDIPPAPVEPDARQKRIAFTYTAKKRARREGVDWIDLLHGMALFENEGQVAA